MNTWECTVCGYVHKESTPPEKCPVCEAPQKMFKEVGQSPATTEVATSAGRKWRCTVCGYIHTGETPPETCPVCGAAKNMFVELDASGKPLSEPQAEPVLAAVPMPTGKGSRSLLNSLGNLVLKLHLHPITVHFPNGILPAAVVFLGIAILFNLTVLENVAFYNLVFVLVMLPIVLFTGYLEWQKRYMGAKTLIFFTKIICSLVVLAATNILVFWRVIDPAVAAKGSPWQLVYFGIAAVMLLAAGIAGHLGGKLVFGSRG